MEIRLIVPAHTFYPFHQSYLHHFVLSRFRLDIIPRHMSDTGTQCEPPPGATILPLRDADLRGGRIIRRGVVLPRYCHPVECNEA